METMFAKKEEFRQWEPSWKKDTVWVPSLNPRNSFIKPITKIKIPAASSPFMAKDAFVRGHVGIDHISDAFTKAFTGKIENPNHAREIIVHRLRQSSSDTSIISALRGVKKAETLLYHLFYLIEHHRTVGALLDNGYPNLFYVRDCKGKLQAVFIRWRGKKWSIYSFPISRHSLWRVSGRVFSHGIS